jgi:hypothetical protein
MSPEPMPDALLAILGLLLILLPVVLMFAGFAAISWLVIRHRASIADQLKRIYGFSGLLPAWNIRHKCRARYGRQVLRATLAADPHGIYLVVRLRPFGDREPLFVPWEDAGFSDVRFLWKAASRLKFRQVPGFHLDFDRQLMVEIERGSQRPVK